MVVCLIKILQFLIREEFFRFLSSFAVFFALGLFAWRKVDSRLTLFHNDDTVTLLFRMRLRMWLQYGRMRLFGQKGGGDGVDFARN